MPVIILYILLYNVTKVLSQEIEINIHVIHLFGSHQFLKELNGNYKEVKLI